MNKTYETISYINDKYLISDDLSYNFRTNEGVNIVEQIKSYMNQIEYGKNVFTCKERNCILNYAYMFDDVDNAKLFADKLFYQKKYVRQNAWITMLELQEKINYLPDKRVGLAEMHNFGYSQLEMLPLKKEKALELLKYKLPLYQLYSDNSESIVKNKEDIMQHHGLFGVKIKVWEEYRNQSIIEEQVAFSIANRFICIKTCTEGYDYSIFNAEYELLDDGIYDNPCISMKEVLQEILIDLKVPMYSETTKMYYHTEVQGNIRMTDEVVFIDYEEFMKIIEQVDK